MAGALLIGGAHGIAQFYRYAAADALPEERKSVAVSLVLAGADRCLCRRNHRQDEPWLVWWVDHASAFWRRCIAAATRCCLPG